MKIIVNGKECTFIKKLDNSDYIVYEKENKEQDIVEESELIKENPNFNKAEPTTDNIINEIPFEIENFILPTFILNQLTLFNMLLTIQEQMYFDEEPKEGYKFNTKMEIIKLISEDDISITDVIFKTKEDCEKVLKCFENNGISFKQQC